MLTRTQYRSQIKAIIKGIHPFKSKVEVLSNIDFTKIESFNQPNISDTDIWKIIGSYLGQNISLNLQIRTDKKLERVNGRKTIKIELRALS